MARKIYSTKNAMLSGAYSHGVDAGGFVFLSGQTARDSASNNRDVMGIGAQTEECFKMLSSVLEVADLSLDDVVKVNVYLTDMKNFDEMDRVYKIQFSEPYPARTAVILRLRPLQRNLDIDLTTL